MYKSIFKNNCVSIKYIFANSKQWQHIQTFQIVVYFACNLWDLFLPWKGNVAVLMCLLITAAPKVVNI